MKESEQLPLFFIKAIAPQIQSHNSKNFSFNLLVFFV